MKQPRSIYSLIIITTLFLGLTLCADNKKYEFAYKSHMIPHPQKAHRGGQDAYFNSSKMLVVADGVGGWNNQGVDPSKYSRFLCTAAQQHLIQNQSKYTAQPREVLYRAQRQNQNIGSATMVVVTLSQGLLKYCYLGDSGLMVIRRYQKLLSIYQFVEQQHSFNFPYQLAMEKYGGDSPEHSICGDIEVVNGDIVVVGSDGLFDNIDFHEILNFVRTADAAGVLLDTLAQELAELAIKRGHNQKFNSPFAQRAKRQGLSYLGGKLDDTTVIIGQVVPMRQNIVEL